eukprot:sb/3461961/
MPHPSESPWWRGKHSNRVGFFPSTCVEVIPGSENRKPSKQITTTATTITVTTTDPTGDGARKKRNLKGRLAVLFASRPERDSLRQKGILRGRVFGAHLSELLHDSDRKVPLIVEVCCKTLEAHGVVEGIYRKSGINSNIQKLRLFLSLSLSLSLSLPSLSLIKSSGINVPGIAVATVTHNYLKREPDELELRVGDLVSIIDMPHPSESPWWRGKHSNRVGFFPSTCVEVIPGSENRKPSKQITTTATTITVTTTDPTGDGARKKRNLKGRLAVLFASRPERDSLRQKGILRGRVFGAHLSELLHDSDRKVPLIVEVCCKTLEAHGVVEGIYRKSGINSNIQKLRQEFDSEAPPSSINEERYMNDIHCVASLCKMYFRELPDPLLTYQLYDSFAHLNVIARSSAQHGMHSRNLALVWAPNLLKPVECESDASAFTAIKIQSVVLQFLIDHAGPVFLEEGGDEGTEEVVETASSSIHQQQSNNNGACNSPFLDSASQTSSVQIISAAGMSAHRRAANRIILTAGGPVDQEEGETETEEEVVSDVIRNRATSDVTNISTAKYQYLMKIPLMELGEAQRAHSVKEEELVERTRPGFFKRRHKKNKRHSGHVDGSPPHWTKSFFGLSSKLRLHTGRSGAVRPVISGPCGFVSDPYSTVIGGNQQNTPGTPASAALAGGSSSCISSAGSSAFNSVLLLGNQVGSAEESFDKSEFVAEWCSDAIRQFLSGKSITQIQNNSNTNAVTDRSSVTSTTTDGSKERLDNILRSKSLPNKRKHTTEPITSHFKGSITHSLITADLSCQPEPRQLKIPRRPLSCVSCPENATTRQSRSDSLLNNKFRSSLNIEHRTSNSIIVSLLQSTQSCKHTLMTKHLQIVE